MGKRTDDFQLEGKLPVSQLKLKMSSVVSLRCGVRWCKNSYGMWSSPGVFSGVRVVMASSISPVVKGCESSGMLGEEIALVMTWAWSSGGREVSNS